MIIAVTVLIALSLMAVSVLTHYEALRITGALLPRLPIRPRQRVVVIIAACLASHIVQVLIYAAVFAVLHHLQVFGTITGAFTPGLVDFLYFSLTSYTTLGIGDIYPTGALRLIAGLESLNGLVVITWSASFTYLVMQPFWHPGR